MPPMDSPTLSQGLLQLALATKKFRVTLSRRASRARHQILPTSLNLRSMHQMPPFKVLVCVRARTVHG